MKETLYKSLHFQNEEVGRVCGFGTFRHLKKFKTLILFYQTFNFICKFFNLLIFLSLLLPFLFLLFRQWFPLGFF